MPFDVRFAPKSTNSTTLDDRGFVSSVVSLDYNVTSDVAGQDANTVRQLLQASLQLPREGVVHPTSNLAILRSISLNQVGPTYYEGTLSYRSEARPANQLNENQNPWDQPASFSFRSITSEVPVDEDANGMAIVNPGTMEPVDGITRPITDFGFTITKHIIGLNPSGINEFANRVNSTPFLLFPAGVCRTGDITADPQIHNNTPYHTVVVPVFVREVYGGRNAAEAWHHRRRLQGFYEVVTIDGEARVVRALDDEGQPVSTPVLLDMNGNRLAAGMPPVFINTARHQTADFNGFNIL